MAMKTKRKQHGLTLTEMTVVIAVIALLVSLALPAVRALFSSFESDSAATSMISAALSSARAIAAKNQRYAGIRFQKAGLAQNMLESPQYMIFIIQDMDTLAYGFRAVPGLKPIKLPESIEVIDMTLVTGRNSINPPNSTEVRLDDPTLTDQQRDNLLDEEREFTDITTFSIIFSPSGKLVIQGIRVRNKDGYPDTLANTSVSNDDVFNKKAQVDNGTGQFYQDDYFGTTGSAYIDLGLGPEKSRSNFVVVDKKKFIEAFKKRRAWSDYLAKLAVNATYINPYSGTIINK
jgi:prepilin-type N-terminal cleavage/methylation domain-containing protein